MSQQPALPLFENVFESKQPDSELSKSDCNDAPKFPSPADTAPMLQHYLQVQSDHPDHLIFFQVGDFYEVFYESAIKVAEILNIRLTSRDKAAENPVPMCGVPIRAFESYLPKILIAGFRAVVVSQVEEGKKNPKTGKLKVVRREITRIVTPGVRLEEGLNERVANFCAAAVFLTEGGAVCAYDISTGQLKIKECESKEELLDALERFRVREIILPSTFNDRSTKSEKWVNDLRSRLNESEASVLTRAFSDSPGDLSEFITGFKSMLRPVRSSLGALFGYIKEVSCGQPR